MIENLVATTALPETPRGADDQPATAESALFAALLAGLAAAPAGTDGSGAGIGTLATVAGRLLGTAAPAGELPDPLASSGDAAGRIPPPSDTPTMTEVATPAPLAAGALASLQPGSSNAVPLFTAAVAPLGNEAEAVAAASGDGGAPPVMPAPAIEAGTPLADALAGAPGEGTDEGRSAGKTPIGGATIDVKKATAALAVAPATSIAGPSRAVEPSAEQSRGSAVPASRGRQRVARLTRGLPDGAENAATAGKTTDRTPSKHETGDRAAAGAQQSPAPNGLAALATPSQSRPRAEGFVPDFRADPVPGAALPGQPSSGTAPHPAGGGPAPAASPPSPPARSMPVAQLGLFVVRAASQRLSHLVVRLEPAALGRVEISLRFKDDGRVAASFRAQQGDALQMLRAEAPAFARLFTEHGIELAAGGLDFGLMQGETGSQHDRRFPAAALGGGPPSSTVVPEAGRASAGLRLGLLDLTV